MDSDSFYNKVGQFEHKELVDFIDHNQTELTIKINNQFLKTNVNYIKSAKYFSLIKFHNFDFSNEPVSCMFRVKDEIYLFNSYLNSSKLDYTIEIPSDIFQLQRRNDFRMTIPLGLIYQCVINYDRRGAEKSIKTELRDLSMGGCQLSLPAFKIELEVDDEFDMSLKIDKFEFNHLALKARHVKHIKEQDTVLIGASFINLDGDNLTEMRALLMYLDRKSRGKTE